MRRVTLPCLLILPSLVGCNLLAGIEKAAFDESYDPDESGTRLAPGVEVQPDACSNQIDADEAVIRGCIYRISCDPRPVEFSISDCITNSLQTTISGESCGLRASSCDEIEECTKVERLEVEDSLVCNSSGDSICTTDDEAIYCGADPYKVNCPELGAICASGFDAPGITLCVPEPEPSCEGLSDGESYCADDSDVIFWCVDGRAQGYDCDGRSRSCEEDEEGEAFCSGRTGSCDDEGEQSCENGSVIDCDEEGRSLKFDCAASGLTCDARGTSEARCVARGCEEAPRCEESCLDEKTAQICIGGAAVTLDCSEYGSTACVNKKLRDGTLAVACGAPKNEVPQDDSCALANNDNCDEWGSDAECEPGTDVSDCGDTCQTSHDGVCDEPTFCNEGTDSTDCRAPLD